MRPQSARRRSMRLPVIAIASVVMLAGGLTACSTDPDPAPGESTEATSLVIATGTDTGPNWDPASKVPDSYLTYTVYDPLFYVHTISQELTPWVAESYEWDEPRTTLTLTLRDGVVFTDGTPYDAEAVVANLEYVRGNPAADRYPDLIDVTRIEAIDEHTVEISISTPNSQLLPYLGMYRMASPAALEDPETLSQNPVGSGPYVLDQARTVADSEYVFVRNEDYWNPDAFPYDTVTVKLIPDVTARVNALKSGQVSFAIVNPATADEVKASDLELFQYPSLWIGLAMGDGDGELGSPLQDIRVRQAVAHAIDRDTIRETIDRDFSIGGNQIWTEGQPFFDAALDAELRYDPDRARELLAEAGYADGFSVDIPTFAGWLAEPYQPIIGQYLADVGITVNWDVGTFQDVFAAWENDIVPMYTATARFSTTLAQLIYPEGIHNAGRYVSPELDELILTINGGTEAEAAAAAQELGRYVFEQVWFVVISQPYQLYGHTQELQISGDPTLIRGLTPAG